jgi:hypothetical protein
VKLKKFAVTVTLDAWEHLASVAIKTIDIAVFHSSCFKGFEKIELVLNFLAM